MRIQSLFLLLLLLACNGKKSTQTSVVESKPLQGTFAFDVDFIKSFKKVLVLGTRSSQARVLIVGDYQGRVMTSSSEGDEGKSYGWINYDLIRSGKIKTHMNPFGGEDRFWLGPEGGQYGIYFKKGSPFDFEHWQTPPTIDTEPFALVSSDSSQATFRRKGTFINFQGTTFHIDIQRQIRLLNKSDIETEFGISLGKTKTVSFQSINTISNMEMAPWRKKNGLLSIWILGMFKPTNTTVIILPHKKPTGNGINDNYFGAIPADRIINEDSVLLLKGDGRYRAKVGIVPSLSVNVVGSYDTEKHILTLVKFDLDVNGDYVNSKWEIQKDPFGGDAVNAYNDGPQADGSQLGPFYELESSSPVRELRGGESLTHRHITLHLEGEEEELNKIAEKTLGVGLNKIKGAFNP